MHFYNKQFNFAAGLSKRKLLRSASRTININLSHKQASIILLSPIKGRIREEALVSNDFKYWSSVLEVIGPVGRKPVRGKGKDG